jgi:hypothetical protein
MAPMLASPPVSIALRSAVPLNWFLLSSVRLSMNYFYVSPLNDGSSSIFQMRAQLDF